MNFTEKKPPTAATQICRHVIISDITCTEVTNMFHNQPQINVVKRLVLTVGCCGNWTVNTTAFLTCENSPLLKTLHSASFNHKTEHTRPRAVTILKISDKLSTINTKPKAICEQFILLSVNCLKNWFTWRSLKSWFTTSNAFEIQNDSWLQEQPSE